MFWITIKSSHQVVQLSSFKDSAMASLKCNRGLSFRGIHTKSIKTVGLRVHEAFGGVYGLRSAHHSSTRSASYVVCLAAGSPQSDPGLPRRTALIGAVSVGLMALQPVMSPPPAAADILKDALRGYTRPDVGVQDAVVILMDARSTLKEIQGIAATPADSQERFQARAFWPAYAKRLRAVAEAAPVVAGVVTGAADKEETLGEYYGGKVQGEGVADAVYQGLGRVLTISGRTIRPEAQATPEASAAAEQAIDRFLGKVPAPLLKAAQEFRVQRAKAAAP